MTTIALSTAPATVELAPTCHVCGVELILRPASKSTREQSWRGTWFDHPGDTPFGHTGSILHPSPELAAQTQAFADAYAAAHLPLVSA